MRSISYILNQGQKNDKQVMDYSALVKAVQNGDEVTANRLCAEALPILKRYLIATLNASPEDAEDAVQRMFEYVIPKIRRSEIHNPGGLLSYMLTGAKHAFLKEIRDFDPGNLDELDEEPVVEASQIWNLINEERLSILEMCRELLKGNYRLMVDFIFEHPAATTDDIAEHFNISENNAWIRKHRVIKQLSDCAEKNS
jgi:DNA-directed RNA polymerase specialized sigma24 family protein